MVSFCAGILDCLVFFTVNVLLNK